MDLIQGSTIAHRPAHGSTGVLSLPWKLAEERAPSSDLEEARSFKELSDHLKRMLKPKSISTDIPVLKTRPRRQR